jgi:hypothetical protein
VRIDILFPFHRNDALLRQAILSLHKSNNVLLNPIFIDDRQNKDDDLSELFKIFSSYEYIKTEGKVGYGEALRLGSQIIGSNYVALMNSDDLISPNRLINQVKLLEKSEISIAKMHRIKTNNQRIKPYTGDIESSTYDPIFLILGAYGANSTWCMHTSWWKENAFFDNAQCLDWRIALKAFHNSHLSYTSEPLYYYRKHNDQVTKSRTISFQEMEPTYLLWQEHLSRYGLENVSYEIFNLIATPWNADIKFFDLNFFKFYKKLLSISKQLDIKIQQDFIKIIKRRNIFALAKTNDIRLIGKLLKNSNVEILELFKDIIYNSKNKYFK